MTSRRQVERALDAHADELSAYPNVVGLGMSEHDARTDSVALAVYVTEKKPASELAADELLPGFVEISDGGNGAEVVRVPVRVIEIGEVQPEGAGDVASDADATTDVENRRNEGDDGSTFAPQ